MNSSFIGDVIKYLTQCRNEYASTAKNAADEEDKHVFSVLKEETQAHMDNIKDMAKKWNML